MTDRMTPTIIGVEFVSDTRAFVKAECGDHIGWQPVTYEEGMQVEATLNRERQFQVQGAP